MFINDYLVLKVELLDEVFVAGLVFAKGYRMSYSRDILGNEIAYIPGSFSTRLSHLQDKYKLVYVNRSP